MSRERTWEPHTVELAIRSLVNSLSRAVIVVPIDCRGMSKVLTLNGAHSGCYPANFAALIKNEGFLDVLNTTRKIFEKHIQDPSVTSLYLVFVDNSGQHRSVAAAHTFHKLLCSDSRCHVSGSAHPVAAKTPGCNWCCECKEPRRGWPEQTLEAFKAASGAWACWPWQ